MVKYPWAGGDRPPPPSPPPPWLAMRRHGFWNFIERHLASLSVIIMVALLLGIILYPYTLITVPSGQAGVLWKRFSGPGIYCWCILPSGTVLDPLEIRHEGVHFIWPWDKLFLYDLRLQSSTQKFNAISKDGVSVTAEITIRYQLAVNSVAVLHEFIGPSYLNTVLIPEIGSVTRAVIANFAAEEVYSTKRQEIQDEIQKRAHAALEGHLDTLFQSEATVQSNAGNYRAFLQNSITILDTPVLSIELPKEIVAAINEKIEQFYKIQEYHYRAEREIEESKRKQIEADGIAAFQRTVTQGISDSYLRWQGIQATLALAQSPNTKIVIIGNGKGGLPLILGNLDGGSTTDKTKNTTDKNGPSTKDTDNTDKTDKTDTNKDNDKSDKTDKTDKTKTDKTNKDKTDKTDNTDTKPSLDLSDIKSILSRLSDALRSNSDNKSTTDKTSK